jgi:hypothetical protein
VGKRIRLRFAQSQPEFRRCARNSVGVDERSKIFLQTVQLQSLRADYAASRPSLPTLPSRLMCTSNSEMAAGVTPEMRDA